MNNFVKPKLEILDNQTVETIVEGAYEILKDPGFIVANKEGLRFMADSGASVDFDKKIVRVTSEMIDKALSTASSGFTMWNQTREKEAAHLESDQVHFVTGGTAISVQDYESEEPRQPVTKDMIEHCVVMDSCEHITFSSATFTLSDIPKEIADTYRFFLSLLYSKKPVMATSFSKEGYNFMKEMMVVMAGDQDTLHSKPSHLFCVNISSPVHWSDLVCQNLIDASKDHLPIKVIPIPLGGGTAPVTQVGNLVQITAENLCGLLIHQAVDPGGRFVYGGGPTVMDMRYGTSPMASIEALMMGAANTLIGKYLGLPTSTNIGRTDSKRVDMQGGLESGMAMIMASLAGTNCIRGPGMLEYATTQSLEKLVLDNEICGICVHASKGMYVAKETLAVDSIKELAHSTEGFLHADHTFDWYQKELYFPSDLIDRLTRSAYLKRGGKNARERAHDRVQKILQDHKGGLEEDDPRRKELFKIMKSHTKNHGEVRLPIEEYLSF
jgi:trimethylamine--corrinoid protein Co-methyltransferase